jgi:6-phosphogluconate dehydrogenase
MQLIAEIYDVLKSLAGLSNDEISAVFKDWNTGELESFLVEISGNIVNHRDDLSPQGFLLDKILDKTGMKGTGRWTIQEAAERSVAAPTMAAALDVRYLSARKDERVAAAAVLQGPGEVPSVMKAQIVMDAKDALFCAKVCSYAQGLCVIRAASEQVSEWVGMCSM